MLFSVRNKLLDGDAALVRFRNRVWNVFGQIVSAYYDSCSFLTEIGFYDAAYLLLFDTADRLGFDVTDMESYNIYLDLHEELSDAHEYGFVYDFIEASIETLFNHPPINRHSLFYGIQGINLKKVQDVAIEKYSQLLKDENQPYRLHGTQLVPLVNDQELAEIEMAATTHYDSVNIQIEKAWALFSNRKSPDYENSIKESISAVESMCCIITGMPKATLGGAIKKLDESGIHIHSAMKNAFSELYGYTSDEKGIRHGGIDFTNAPPEDAKYMLVSCSAFVNYLIEKWEKVEQKE